jgi:hypothetical protein
MDMKVKNNLLSIVFLNLVVSAQAAENNTDSNVSPRLSTDQVENQIVLDKIDYNPADGD